LIFGWAAAINQSQGQRGDFHTTTGVDIGFLCFYWLEALLKLYALGLRKYADSGWNL
jgi:hypothetical protein